MVILNDQISDIASIIESKGIGHRRLRFSDKDLRECIRVIMGIQVPLMIIHQREVLVMSGVFLNLRVTRLTV
jgi:hypothetical protein